MYLTFNDKYWAIDIEGDDLPSNVVWCLCAVNIRTGEEVELVGHQAIREWVDARKAEGCKFVGHNIIGYDAPTLNRLVGTSLTISDILDTMVMSMVYSPSLEGGHSLEGWGRRLKYPKGVFNDWSKLSREMLVYCAQDARLCRRIFLELLRRMTAAKFTALGLEIEHRSWQLIQKQKQDGFAFNLPEAHVLYAKVREAEQKLQDRIYEIWPPELKVVATYKRPFKKDGTPSANFMRHVDAYEKVIVSKDHSEYDCYAHVCFNIGSPQQRTAKLLELGWQPYPDERTKTGQPQPTRKGSLVPSLKIFVEESGQEGPRLIAEWIDLNARGNMINTWIEAFNESTGCIHGSLWLANTLRFKHSDPNTANIPAVRVFERKDETGKVVEKYPLRGMDGVYTYEARNLWTTRDRSLRRLVGVDAKGIQLRVLANYLNNPAFTKEVIDGDPHSYNQEIGGFRTRAIAKTFIYAFLLGAGDEKVGQIIGGSAKDGKATKARFINNFPGLAELLDDLSKQVERTGRIRLCDGTPIIVQQPHTRLGYLLQGDESRLMKMANILAFQEIRKRKLDVIKVGDIHDEWQNDVLLPHVEPFAYEVCPWAFRTAGERFNYRVPIDCDAKVGLTWAETH